MPAYGILDCSAIVAGARWQSRRPSFAASMSTDSDEREADAQSLDSMRRNTVPTKVRGRGALTKCAPCGGLLRLRAADLAADRGSVAACPSIGPAKAIRPSLGGGAAGAG
jgi:hypothetical protein